MIKEINNFNVREFSKRLEFYDNNILIGYLDYSLIYDRIEIDNIFVYEKYRKNKIGTKLMEYLIEIAKKKQINKHNIRSKTK